MIYGLNNVAQLPHCSTEQIEQHKKDVELVKSILEHTKADFEKIINSQRDTLILEALARPNPDKMNLHLSDGENKYKKALFTLLDIVEETGLTFLLFEHMLHCISTYIEICNDPDVKFSINAYSFDIENPHFKNLIAQYKYSSRLIIELTEKKTWSFTAINHLKSVQKDNNTGIAMDDINPTVSGDNYSMKNLEKFKNNSCYVDMGKIDGKYFHQLFTSGDYQSLKERIIFDHQHYKMTTFIIEWIETEEQDIFAKQLEKEADFSDFTFGYQGYY